VSVDAQQLVAALPRWCSGMHAAAPERNALDGRLGDADLGVTLDRCATLIEQAMASLPASLEGIFKACAQASAKASGSSFGTLLTVALMTAMQQTAGVARLDRTSLAAMLGEIVAALSSRGGASLGDKTVLDGLEAIRVALASGAAATGLKRTAVDAVRQAIGAFRDKPNRIGRARMFAEQTIGQDDPGMVALLRMAESL
jgi:dihydroxyacetone kinase-like protein